MPHVFFGLVEQKLFRKTRGRQKNSQLYTFVYSLISEVDYSQNLGVTTSTLYDFASLRSAFVIVPFEKKSNGDVVGFGDKVILQAHPDLDCGYKRFLCSAFKTPTSYSRKSKNQQVYLSIQKTNQCLWTIEPVDP